MNDDGIDSVDVVDVFERVRVKEKQVRDFSRFDGSTRIQQVQEPRGIECCCLQCL